MTKAPENVSRPAERGTLERHLSRRFQMALLLEGALVGLVGGGVVTLYRLALRWGESTMRSVTAELGRTPLGILCWLGVLALICLAVGALVRWEPYTSGSGIPQVTAEISGRLDMPWHRVMGAKFAEGTLDALAGLSLGREGPSVQLGGMAGKAVSRLLGRERGEERILVTCGAASGMAAAFHAPLTGVMFALEELHKVFTPQLVISAMMASVVSDFFVSQVLGVEPVLTFVIAQGLPHASYLLIVAMGVCLGVVGALNNLGMFAMQDAFARIRERLPFARYALAFALTGAATFLAPQLLCGGDAIIELLQGATSKPVAMLLALLAGKYLLTAVCFGSGAPGGTLFPLVVLGALVGCVFGEISVWALDMPSGYVANFIVLGIAGMFAGSVRAPVTAIVLAFELTGSLETLLAVVIVSIFAYVIANLMNVDPFYERLFANLLGVSIDDEKVTHAKSRSKLIHTHMVETGSPVEGRRLSEVAWPEDCLVVTVTRGGVELVPKGYLRLEALDRLLVIMDAEGEDATERRLKDLCRANLGISGR